MNSLGYARGTADSIQQSEQGEWMQAGTSQSSHSASCGRLPKEVRPFDADLHIVFMDIGILSCKENIFTLKATQLYNEWLLSCFLSWAMYDYDWEHWRCFFFVGFIVFSSCLSRDSYTGVVVSCLDWVFINYVTASLGGLIGRVNWEGGWISSGGNQLQFPAVVQLRTQRWCLDGAMAINHGWVFVPMALEQNRLCCHLSSLPGTPHSPNTKLQQMFFPLMGISPSCQPSFAKKKAFLGEIRCRHHIFCFVSNCLPPNKMHNCKSNYTDCPYKCA